MAHMGDTWLERVCARLQQAGIAKVSFQVYWFSDEDTVDDVHCFDKNEQEVAAPQSPVSFWEDLWELVHQEEECFGRFELYPHYEELAAWFYRPGLELSDPRFFRLLGNSFGIFLAEERFGISLTRTSDGKELPTRTLSEMLVYFALDTIPTLAQFLRDMSLETWMMKGARQLSAEVAL